jgi:DNA-binding protein YbaB
VAGVTTPGDERARLDARSAQLRTRVDDLLGQFTERTAQLRAAQQAAAALTATLTSPDELVRVTVDATGMLTDLHIDRSAFERTTPDQLAHTISDVVRRATTDVRRRSADLLRPLTEGLPDLADLADGAPSLSDMLPKIPDYPAPEPPTDDDMPAHWLTDDE